MCNVQRLSFVFAWITGLNRKRPVKASLQSFLAWKHPCKRDKVYRGVSFINHESEEIEL